MPVLADSECLALMLLQQLIVADNPVYCTMTVLAHKTFVCRVCNALMVSCCVFSFHYAQAHKRLIVTSRTCALSESSTAQHVAALQDQACDNRAVLAMDDLCTMFTPQLACCVAGAATQRSLCKCWSGTT